MSYEIAVILTVYNRKQKTISCLESLFSALDSYNAYFTKEKSISVVVYITDDGCTDGTSEAIKVKFPSREIKILQGTGSLYWAGGMRYAWNAALKDGVEWDFYLLMNDDTMVRDNLFDELFMAHQFSLSQYGKPGIYSGVTCDPKEYDKITYGGDTYLSKARTAWRRVEPNGTPQLVDRTNANILMVSSEVVRHIGIFYEGYIHGGADEDYAIMVRRAGYPALITGHVSGECEYDHNSDEDECRKLMKMSLAERSRYLSIPTRSDHDYLVLMRRLTPRRYMISWVLRKIRFFMPLLYYKINRFRRIYK